MSVRDDAASCRSGKRRPRQRRVDPRRVKRTMCREAQFIQLLPVIDALSMSLCRRRGIVGVEAEDFAAQVRARFVETSYAPLEEFRGESSIQTYLAVVICSWLKDTMVARDGRWRPSAAAIRSGAEAVKLERLMVQGGRSVDEAIHERMASGSCDLSDRELRLLVRRLPVRSPLRPRRVSLGDLELHTASQAEEADARLAAAERFRAVEKYRSALQTALDELPKDDKQLVLQRFFAGRTLAEIARAQNVQQKPLYRKLERSLGALKHTLQAAGVSASAVRELLE